MRALQSRVPAAANAESLSGQSRNCVSVWPRKLAPLLPESSMGINSNAVQSPIPDNWISSLPSQLRWRRRIKPSA